MPIFNNDKMTNVTFVRKSLDIHKSIAYAQMLSDTKYNSVK